MYETVIVRVVRHHYALSGAKHGPGGPNPPHLVAVDSQLEELVGRPCVARGRRQRHAGRASAARALQRVVVEVAPAVQLLGQRRVLAVPVGAPAAAPATPLHLLQAVWVGQVPDVAAPLQGEGSGGRCLLVQDALQPLIGQVEGDHVALLKAAVNDAGEACAGAQVLRGRGEAGGRKGERWSPGHPSLLPFLNRLKL